MLTYLIPRLSIRTGVCLAVLAMGVLVLMAVLVTGETYRDMMLDNERQAFTDMAAINVNFIVTNTTKHTTDYALSLQANPRFRQAFERRDEPALNAYLNEHLQRFFFISTFLKLDSLVAYDTGFNRVGYSSDSHMPAGGVAPGCPDLLEEARARTGPARLRIMTTLCSRGGQPYVTTLVPIGGLRLAGYLMVNVDPTQNVIAAEDELGMPLRLSTGDERYVYESDDWPGPGAKEAVMEWRYVLRDRAGEPIYTFEFASDVAPLYQTLAHARYLILALAAIATLAAVAIVVALLQRTVLSPLARLSRHVRMVRADQARLCDPIEVEGNYEVAELAAGFNGLSQRLCKLYTELREMAFVDSLTGLPNRAVFYDRLEQAIRLARRSGSFALFMLDLDRFKYVNDTLGHHIGDRLLQEMAHRLEHCVRASDTVARLGGDEFAILLPGLSEPQETIGIVRKILAAVARPVHADGHNLRIRTSIGIVYCPRDGVFSDRLMQKADVAMYHAKQTRSGFTFYQPELDRHTLFEHDVETELKQAMEREELELVYQPQIGLPSQQLVGVKALIRWRHPERGILMPEDFIPLIEQADGITGQVTEWILRRCFTQAALWREEGKDINISVNLPVPVGDTGRMIATVEHALKQHQTQAARITIELDEQDIAVDIDQARELLDRLRRTGVRITVGGCGGRRSVLPELEGLPIDAIHIDRSFVFYMDKDSSDASIVRSTIEAGHELGVSVVAEGVETEGAWKMLAELGCDIVQGRCVSPPLTGPEVVEWARKREAADDRPKYAGGSGA